MSHSSWHGQGWIKGWKRTRSRILQRDPICKECEKQGRVTASQEVDHIKPRHLGGDESDNNLQGLCSECHAAKSAAEQSEQMTKGERIRFDSAGFPIWE